MFPNEQEVELVDADTVVEIARAHLNFLFGDGNSVDVDKLQGPSLQRVNVTLRKNGVVRGSMSGHGPNFTLQLLDAVRRASLDKRFAGRLVKADLPHVSLEVWLQTSSIPIPLAQRANNETVDLGVDGVEVAQGSAFAYYKPSVAITSHFSNSRDMFSALCKKAKLQKNAWKNVECEVKKTSWLHFCQTSDGRTLEMQGLRVIRRPHLTHDLLRNCIRQGATYFRNNQHSDGSFCYKYRPVSNIAKTEETNPVRASGCVYAVAASVSLPFLCDSALVSCLERSIDRVMQRYVPLESGGGYIADNKAHLPGGKLGTTALLLLALLTPKLRETHESLIQSFIKAIKSAQLENGLLNCAFGAGRNTDTQINFFPGQALLALVKRAELGDRSCKSHYEKAFQPYREHFRAAPSTAFVGWQADVWCRAALLDSNTEYAAFVFEQLDWILQFQIPNEPKVSNSGAFGGGGKSANYSSIVYTEALARGAHLAYEIGDQRWSIYKEALDRSLEFCTKLWLTDDQSTFFPQPERAIGGVATSLANFDVRADVVQHAITLAMCVLERPMLLRSSLDCGQ